MPQIVPALAEPELSQAKILFREYGQMPGVAPCVVDYESEVSALPGAYAPPSGRLLLAVEENSSGGTKFAGCVALRAWRSDACEMKRLYVRPEFRAKGVGRELVKELIVQARSIGYRRVLLDTLPSMREAHRLYRALGFREVPSYQEKPLPEALFFELALQ